VLSFSKKVYGISNAQIKQISDWAEFFEIQNRPNFELFPLGVSCLCDSPTGKNFVEEDSRRIIIVGAFDLRKNPFAIFTCLNSIPLNVKLSVTFIGPGGLFENELHTMINFWGKSSLRHVDFKMMKNVSDEILHRELSSADFSLFLSFAEGFGLPVIESLAHATPVIISAEPSVLESAGQTGVVVVPATDQSLLREVFYRFCTDGEFLSGLKANCVPKSSNMRDWTLLK
jgi:glycosyltransferase involved in cell wall biosynthesis